VIAHWDVVEGTDLGLAAGTVNVDVHRIALEPGEVNARLSDAVAEEILFVLEGSGVARLDGNDHELRAGDCLVHIVGRKDHELRAGPDAFTALAFRHPIRPDTSPRTATVVNVEDVEAEDWGDRDMGGVTRPLGKSAGSVRSGLNHEGIARGKLNTPPHCHSAEEEVFVILDGEATVLLGEEEHALRAGHVVARPPGTGVPHTFRAESAQMTMLSYGTREPNDIAYYARSHIVYLRGVGVFGRMEPVDPKEIW
jgi:uncharacterized cupin superfamily protein